MTALYKSAKVHPLYSLKSMLGIAVVIPAYYAISMFFGGLASLVLGHVAPKWTTRFLIVLAAGFIAGESLTGVVIAIQKIVAGG